MMRRQQLRLLRVTCAALRNLLIVVYFLASFRQTRRVSAEFPPFDGGCLIERLQQAPGRPCSRAC